jgi:hypothetical protein
VDVTSARTAVDAWLRALAAPLAPAPQRITAVGDVSATPPGVTPAPFLPPPAPFAAPSGGPDAATAAASAPSASVLAPTARAARVAAPPIPAEAPATVALPRAPGTSHARPGFDATADAVRAPRPHAAAEHAPDHGPDHAPGRASNRPYLRPAREQALPPWPRTAGPDAEPSPRRWPDGPGPVDVASALAPLLAAPGTVPAGMPLAAHHGGAPDSARALEPAHPAVPAPPSARESAADLADLVAEALEEEARMLGILELEP